MKISFVLPTFYVHPIGGYKVVYEYANLLAKKGHCVSIVLPLPDNRRHPRGIFNRIAAWLWFLRVTVRGHGIISWFTLDRTVRLVVARDLDAASIPDADAVFATGWTTAEPVLQLPSSKGEKFYLVQGYEILVGPKEIVDGTWRMPFHLVVISKSLQALGVELGAGKMTYIPNAIDLSQFRKLSAPQTRPQHIVAMYHELPTKGFSDALAILCAFHNLYPDIPVTIFGVGERHAQIPAWMTYHCDPAQEDLVGIYNSGTVYMAASLIEGWALPPAEAIACGCVFVGTDIGGFADYAIHEETALLSPPKDRHALLKNLIRAVTDEALAGRLRERGEAKLAEFSWQASGDAMDSLLRSTVATGNGALQAASDRMSSIRQYEQEISYDAETMSAER